MRAGMVTLLGGRRGSTVYVAIGNEAVADIEASGTATASITYESDGGLSSVGNSGSTAPQWLTNGVTGSNYEIRVTPTSDTFSSGTTGSWLQLSSNRTWSVSRSSLGTKECTATVEIGLNGTSTALDTATITLTATIEP